MFKIIIMALLIFIGMVGYDNITDKAQPTTPVQQEQQKISKHEKSAAMALFVSLLPPKEEWPSPVHKFYLAFNMDEVIDPIRQNPNWTSLDAMSRDIPQALIAIEDHAFYNHGAIAVEGILRAALANINAGEVVQGGSTLTQQFVKNVFLSHEQSMERKIEEAILSLMLEDNYSKDEILELYTSQQNLLRQGTFGADSGRGRRHRLASLRAHQPQSAGKPRGLQKTSAAGAGGYA